MKAERNISADDKRALLRFVEAVESGKRPSAADARVAAAFMRVAIGEPRKPFLPTRGKRGQPRDEDKSFKAVAPKIGVAQAVARRVGKRTPTDSDFIGVGMAMKPVKSKETVRRYWKTYGPMVRRQLEDDEAMAKLMPTLKDMMDEFGNEFGELPWPKLRPMVESWGESWGEGGTREREQLRQEIRRILGKKHTK